MSWFDTLRSFFSKKPAPVQTTPPIVPAPVLATPAWLTLCEPLTKASEGCCLEAYPDPASGGAPWTIGYGHTVGVTKGMVWTQAQANTALLSDLQSFGSAVDGMVTVPLSAQQKAALVDFTFNLGANALSSSTLLRLLNSGAYDSAANQFALWNQAGGKVMPGLVTRRAREKSLFNYGTWT